MENFLFIVLSERPVCYHLNKIENQIVIDGKLYNEYEDNNYSGFYDWLRNSLGEVIGLRYSRLDGFDIALFNSISKYSYVKFPHDKIMEIYFLSDHSYLDNISNDQDIGVCKLYTQGSIFSILVDIMYLTPSEFFSLPIP